MATAQTAAAGQWLQSFGSVATPEWHGVVDTVVAASLAALVRLVAAVAALTATVTVSATSLLR